MEQDNVGSPILIIQCDDTLCARLRVSSAMALEGAVHDAAMGAELEFREKGGPAFLVVDALIVPK